MYNWFEFCVIINVAFCLDIETIPKLYKNDLDTEAFKSLYQSRSCVELQINTEFGFYCM